MQNRKVSMKGTAPRIRLPSMKKRLQLSGLPCSPFFFSATLNPLSLNDIQIEVKTGFGGLDDKSENTDA